MSKLRKRSPLPARSPRLRNLIALGTGGLFLVAVLVVVAYVSRPTESGAGSPELGEHLHSLLAYGPRQAILVGTHGATALSTDGGKTLAKVDGLDGVDAMESGAGRSGDVIVVAGHEGAKVSRDGARSWSDVTGLPGSDVHSFGLDPANPKHWIAYVVGKGVFATTNAGVAWRRLAAPQTEPMGDALVRGTTIVIPTMPSGLLRSTDGGASWNVVDQNIGGMVLASDPRNANRLYLSGGGPLFVSSDGGSSWSQHELPEGIQTVVPTADGTLIGAGYSSDHRAVLVRSHDDGASWLAAKG